MDVSWETPKGFWILRTGSFSGLSGGSCLFILTLWHGRIGEIRPFILLGLAGWFSGPFCYSGDSLVGVVENAPLLAQRQLDI